MITHVIGWSHMSQLHVTQSCDTEKVIKDFGIDNVI